MKLAINPRKKRRNGRTKRKDFLLWLVVLAVLSSFAWDVLDHKDDVKYAYNKITELLCDCKRDNKDKK